MKTGSITRQIIGSFEDIGKSIVSETGKVPGEVIKSAVTSLANPDVDPNSGAGLGENQVKVGSSRPPKEFGPNSNVTKIGREKDRFTKQAIARAALAELAGQSEKPPQPSVYEEKIREEREKERQGDEAVIALAKNTLPKITGRRPQGDLYGVANKRTKVERKQVGAD